MGEGEILGDTASVRIRSHRELNVYKVAFEVAVDIYLLSRDFPREEMYSLTDQARRSSRSVAANIAEAWRKRRYEAAFIAKLTDAEAEAAETQVWIEFAVKFKYLSREQGKELFDKVDTVLAMIVAMKDKPDQWLIKAT